MMNCRCCGKPVLPFDDHPIHTRCIPKHWGDHAKGRKARRCLEFGPPGRGPFYVPLEDGGSDCSWRYCTSCGYRVPERQEHPYPGHQSGCALVALWRN